MATLQRAMAVSVFLQEAPTFLSDLVYDLFYKITGALFMGGNAAAGAYK